MVFIVKDHESFFDDLFFELIDTDRFVYEKYVTGIKALLYSGALKRSGVAAEEFLGFSGWFKSVDREYLGTLVDTLKEILIAETGSTTGCLLDCGPYGDIVFGDVQEFERRHWDITAAMMEWECLLESSQI